MEWNFQSEGEHLSSFIQVKLAKRDKIEHNERNSAMRISFHDKDASITGTGAGMGRSYGIFMASSEAKVLANDIGVTEYETGRS